MRPIMNSYLKFEGSYSDLSTKLAVFNDPHVISKVKYFEAIQRDLIGALFCPTPNYSDVKIRLELLKVAQNPDNDGEYSYATGDLWGGRFTFQERGTIELAERKSKILLKDENSVKRRECETDLFDSVGFTYIDELGRICALSIACARDQKDSLPLIVWIFQKKKENMFLKCLL